MADSVSTDLGVGLVTGTPSGLPEPGATVPVTSNAIPWWVYALGAVAIGYFVLPELLKKKR